MATYGRSVVAMGLALFSSRWVLSNLGQTDYGLYSVVGSVIIFIVFLNNVTAIGATRFFSLSIGRNEPKQTNHWFNTALNIHVILAVTLLIVGAGIGNYVIRNYLTIPPGRIIACLWVFRISLVSAFISMLSVPFVAMFTSKQKITELAFWGILQTVASFTLAYSLKFITQDKLVSYAFGMVSIICVIQLAQMLRALFIFEECKINYKAWFDYGSISKLLSFTILILIDNAGAMFRSQGSAILLNIFFGPKVNAGYGIANQVTAQTSQLSTAMIGAFSPEITASEGRGDRKRVLYLADQTSKFGTILMAIFTIPILLETDYILKIWLHGVPEYASLFCKLILITFLFDRITYGNLFAINAHGKIALFQITVGLCQVATLPLAWLFLHLGWKPTSIGYAFITTTAIINIGRLAWAKRIFGISVYQWFRAVLVPCTVIIASASLIPYALGRSMNDSVLKFLAVSTSSVLITLSLTWILGVEAEVKVKLVQIGKKKVAVVLAYLSTASLRRRLTET